MLIISEVLVAMIVCYIWLEPQTWFKPRTCLRPRTKTAGFFLLLFYYIYPTPPYEAGNSGINDFRLSFSEGDWTENVRVDMARGRSKIGKFMKQKLH